jgi:hypothetical protein
MALDSVPYEDPAARNTVEKTALGWLGLVSVLQGLLGLIGSWRLTRGRRRWASWVFGSSAVVANVWVAGICAYILDIDGLTFMAIMAFAFVPITLGSGVAWASEATRPGAWRRRSWFVVLPLVLAVALLPLTMLQTPWPLYLTFALSRPAVERLADRVATGRSPPMPCRGGLYWITNAGVDTKTHHVSLVTGRDGYGRRFVRLGPSPSSRRHDVPPYYNVLSERVADRWWYCSEW